MRTVLCHESIIGQFALQQQSTKLFYENEVFSNANIKFVIVECGGAQHYMCAHIISIAVQISNKSVNKFRKKGKKMVAMHTML